jgi:NAD+ diphosphatase
MKPLLTFAGNPLDRADALRRDPATLAALADDFDSLFLPLKQLQVAVVEGESLQLGWLPQQTFREIAIACPPPVLLGLADGKAHFAVDVSDCATADTLSSTDGWQYRDARMAAMALTSADTGIVAQARSQLDWHRRHQFCSVCAAATQPAKGGHVRRCPACGAEHFPRTDPVAIMLIVDGERCLLGQSAGRLARMNAYSALAGFIDQGESIEEAVRREVKEEAGIDVGAVQYHASQPWPFPSSLMIGCHGAAASNQITIDPDEMVSVQWFSRGEVARAMSGAHPDLNLPGPIAIAHHLIRAWLDGAVTL